MMAARLLGVLITVAALMMASGVVVAQGPENSASDGCTSLPGYDPACDVNQDGDMDVLDIQLTAGHWGETGVFSADYWALTGNAGTSPGTHFLGTTDNTALELRVNGQRALHLAPHGTSPNLIGGYRTNEVSAGVYGATIGGGGSSGGPNRVTDNYGTVAGGYKNQAGNDGGATTDADLSTVGGGWGNTASDEYATIGGGAQNLADGFMAFVGGGWGNAAIAEYATVAGGGRTVISDPDTANRVTDKYGFVGGGGNNQAGNGDTNLSNRNYATVAGGKDNTAKGSQATVSGGAGNNASNSYATVSGGGFNVASGFVATVGGGSYNEAPGENATVSGGDGGIAAGDYATVGGGRSNQASVDYATVGGGRSNQASVDYATVGGGRSNQATGNYATIAGGGRSDDSDPDTGNRATDDYCTVGGGGNNQAGDGPTSTDTAKYATVAGGIHNTASSHYATVGGGFANLASGWWATVAGGEANNATHYNATVGGGDGNLASGQGSTVCGGIDNTASGYESFSCGGSLNVAAGDGAVALGGEGNLAGGKNSFAAGYQSQAAHDGTFVWSDSAAAKVIASGAPNQFVARASGGVLLFTDGDASVGAILPGGSGSWSFQSDADSRVELEMVDGDSVLDRLAGLSIQRWHYRTQPSEVLHVGPSGQDFSTAFGIGEDSRYISAVDADGVALAAIQALYRRTLDLEAENSELHSQLEDLSARLATVEQSGGGG
ncbi:MAG: hypothetical protein U9R25_01605 [Chloroflexota bacterium]|nr:hypothetical protein [Chloroflexota bacterium]